MHVIKPLTDLTLLDAEKVVLDRFPRSALEVLHRVMSNPLRSLCDEFGDIAYVDGSPVCFEASILRRLYFGADEVVGKVGGLTCIKRGTDAEALVDVRHAALKSRGGRRLGFGNSQNAETAYIARKSKKIVGGPVSCTRVLWRAVRSLECLAYFVRRKLLKASVPNWKEFSTLDGAGFEAKSADLTIRRIMEVKPEFYDVLMKRYLATNKGLVCSRTTEEIEWIFGERICAGETVVLGAFDSHGPCGYILMTGGKTAKRWQIHDWFAVDNDGKLLEALLKTGCVFLKRNTPAMMLEVCGFPTYVQDLLKKYLPHERPIGHNTFSCGSKEPELREKLRAMVRDELPCWFFGPYDGDVCF